MILEFTGVEVEIKSDSIKIQKSDFGRSLTPNSILSAILYPLLDPELPSRLRVEHEDRFMRIILSRYVITAHDDFILLKINNPLGSFGSYKTFKYKKSFIIDYITKKYNDLFS